MRGSMNRKRWSWVPIMLALSAPAAAEQAKGVATIDGVPTEVEFRTINDTARLRYRPIDGRTGWMTLLLDEPKDVLPLLADDRLPFLWAPIERWAGDDLVRLRDIWVERTRQAWLAGKPVAGTDYAQWSGESPQTRALLQYAFALATAGRDEAAARLLADARQPLDRGPDDTRWQALDWSAVTLGLSTVLRLGGDRQGSIAILREGIAALADSPYRLNAEATLATTLAEIGQYDEALRLIEQSRAAFLTGHKRVEPAPGAMRLFDMIRACALHGLGRHDEAAALTRSIAAAEQPAAQGRIVPPANRDVEERAFLCERDAPALAALWSRDLAHLPIASTALLFAQPAARTLAFDQPTIDRARALFHSAPPMRVLPPRYDAALRGWRTERIRPATR